MALCTPLRCLWVQTINTKDQPDNRFAWSVPMASSALLYPAAKALRLSSTKASGTRARTAFWALSLDTIPVRATIAPSATILATIVRPTSFFAILMIGMLTTVKFPSVASLPGLSPPAGSRPLQVHGIFITRLLGQGQEASTLVALGKSIGWSEITTSDFDAPPRASGHNSGLNCLLAVKDGSCLAHDNSCKDQSLPACPENRISYLLQDISNSPMLLWGQPRVCLIRAITSESPLERFSQTPAPAPRVFCMTRRTPACLPYTGRR